MAVRAGRSHLGPIGEVDGFFQLSIGIVPHRVAGDVGYLHRPVEAAPERDADDEPDNQQCAQGETDARA